MVKRVQCQFCNQSINADVMACPTCGLPGPLKGMDAQLRLLVMQGNKPEAMKCVMHPLSVTGSTRRYPRATNPKP